AIVNPNTDDVPVDLVLTDPAGTSADPVTITVPAGGQYELFLAETPVSLATNSPRNVSFSASLPVFVNALRFFTNERNDSILSVIPIADIAPTNGPVVIPHFADGLNWKTRVVLVNNSDDALRGEVHFVGQGTTADAPPAVVVGSDSGDSAVFEYH